MRLGGCKRTAPTGRSGVALRSGAGRYIPSVRVAFLWLVLGTIPLLHPLSGDERRNGGHRTFATARGVVEPLRADRTDEPDPTATTSSRVGARVPRPIVPERDPGTPAVAVASRPGLPVGDAAPAAGWRDKGVHRSSGARARSTGRGPPTRRRTP